MLITTILCNISLYLTEYQYTTFLTRLNDISHVMFNPNTIFEFVSFMFNLH